MNSLLAWIAVGATGAAGIALYLFQRRSAAHQTGPAEGKTNDDDAAVAAGMLLFTGGAAASAADCPPTTSIDGGGSGGSSCG